MLGKKERKIPEPYNGQAILKYPVHGGGTSVSNLQKELPPPRTLGVHGLVLYKEEMVVS